MEETGTPKLRKTRSDKGKPHGPRKAAPRILPVPEAPIHVRVTRRGMEPFEFGCAQHFTQNGFHVFVYPSKRDPYRSTRREIAISEVIDIEITAARQEFTIARPIPVEEPTELVVPPQPTRGPVVHRAPRGGRSSVIEQLENSTGPIKMDELPNLTFGNHAW